MAESLRDQLAANYDKIVSAEPVNTGAEVDAVDTTTEVVADATIADGGTPSRIGAEPKESKVSEAKPDALDDRPRGPDGKFIPKEEAKPVDTKAIPSAAKVHPAKPPVAAPVVSPVEARPRPQRPSSWKKEYWEHWDKLDPSLAEYLHTRESQFASGVSAYKAEVEAAKPVMEAMNQFLPELKQHNIEPGRWINELGNVHRMLAMGTPQQKMQTLAHVAQAYGVPLQAFSDQQAQQQYLAQGQFRAPYQPPQPQAQQPLTREEAMKLWQEQFLQTSTQKEIESFAADTAKHKHYDEVRNTMSGLLQANLADDLESAYQAALLMPKHSHLREADQQQERQAQEEARKRQEQERVMKARAKAVSPASATPSGSADEKPKGLRAALESSFEQHASGRV